MARPINKPEAQDRHRARKRDDPQAEDDKTIGPDSLVSGIFQNFYL
jgi:hypothetical protein